MEAKILSDDSFEITKTVAAEPVVTKTKYKVSELQFQRARIVADAAKYAAERQAEIDDIDAILSQAQAQGMRITVAIPVEEKL
jgi:hypothetical protein